jgi:PTH1 family peptidyl-tRNA hydrolase
VKYLITGLGNIGEEYKNTRHNIGFMVLDALANASKIVFEEQRYGSIAHLKIQSRTFVLLKPNTYVNLSGKAVNYWLQKEKIPIENLLIIVDDLSLPFGKLRLKEKGSDGGHNGLKNIQQILETTNYPRLRIGIGSDFEKGKQVNYVLGKWDKDEMLKIEQLSETSAQIIKSFGTIGIERTMNQFNQK